MPSAPPAPRAASRPTGFPEVELLPGTRVVGDLHLDVEVPEEVDGGFRVHGQTPKTAAMAATASSIWSSSMMSAGRRRRTVGPAGSAMTP